MKHRILFIGLLLLHSVLNAQFYNGSQMEFGKNRIQYKPIEWSFYRYQRFDVYFFAGGKELSALVAKTASEKLPELEGWLDYSIQNRPRFLIFQNLSDLKQTNVGSGSNPLSLAGSTQLDQQKILLFHNGSAVSFNEQIKAGVAEAVINEFLFGADFRERIRSSTLMNIPDWFRMGLVRYLSRPWSVANDEWLREGMLSGRYFKFNRLRDEDALIAGESMWHYIAHTYGEKVIADILEMTRVMRNVDNGFQYVLGIGLKGVTQEWINYYDKKYYPGRNLFAGLPENSIAKKNKRNRLFLNPTFSKSGRYYSFVRNDWGKAIIYIHDAQSGKRLARIKMGKRLPVIKDLSFPVLAWHPNEEVLLYTDLYEGRQRLNFYNITSRETDSKFIDDIGRIHSMEVSPGGKEIAMTGLRDGWVDLFIFNNIANTFESLTNDGWDEAGATWTADGESIIFSSTRPGDSLNTDLALRPDLAKSYDLFRIYPDSRKLVRLTETPGVNEILPKTNNAVTFHYLSDANGMRNIYRASFDSAVVAVDTAIHYRYFIHSTPVSASNGGLGNFALSGDKALITTVKATKNRIDLVSSSEMLSAAGEKLPAAEWSPSRSLQPEIKPEKEKKEDKPGGTAKVRRIVVFGKGDEAGNNDKPEATTESAKTDSFRVSRQRLYETTYFQDVVDARFDRAYLNQTYQPFNPDGFTNPSVNVLINYVVADLFDDYRFSGGVRLSGNLTGNEYLLRFSSVKKRLDHQFFFHRQGLQNGTLATQRTMLHTLGGMVSYPFSEVARLSGSVNYRNDRTVYLSTDLANLNRPTVFTHWAMAKAEFVFDNTFPEGLNMFTGTRLKVTLEHIRRVTPEATSVNVAGFDFRQYGRITREMIWAFRAAGATSFGPSKLLFYLGGVDNWFIPKFDNSLPPDPDQGYLLQTLGTNMRGFYQNIRNGSSFAVMNAEVRWNFLKFLMKYPVKSDFFNSMQFVAFADVGTAFTGTSPYSENNTFNQQTIESGPIKIILKNQREPVVAGFGAGLRTRILGYFVRVDYARGIDDGQILPRIIYLSLAKDF
ncbi:MAG: PD40 domain-containing protein [Bacteroidetes bacterium]|nr:PD40 domain-containing protein [Bacteroidota bacterium]